MHLKPDLGEWSISLPGNLARHRQAALERAAERRREQQENSGAVTATAATAAGGMEDRVSGGTSGSRVGCEDGSKPPEDADFPGAGHDEITDHIETDDNDTAIEEEINGDFQMIDNDHENKSPHTQQPTEPASNRHENPATRHSRDDTSSKKTA